VWRSRRSDPTPRRASGEDRRSGSGTPDRPGAGRTDPRRPPRGMPDTSLEDPGRRLHLRTLPSVTSGSAPVAKDDRTKPPGVALLSGSVLEIPVQDHLRVRSARFPRYKTSAQGGQDGAIFPGSHGQGRDLAILDGPGPTAVGAGGIDR